MNTRRGKKNFRNFRILLGSGISSTTGMNNITSKIKCKDSTTTMCQTQFRKFTTNDMATVELLLLEFSATKIMT